MAVTLEQFLNAIAGQESGGNYRAVNGRTGALGKYQILPSNVAPWSRRYLGYTISPSQFLNNPALQERLARAVLTDYFRRYGPRGAASAWYSGSPSKHSNYHRFRSNEPSIGEYVDQVLARAGQAPGGEPEYASYKTVTVDKTVRPTSLEDLFEDDLKPGGAAAGLGMEMGGAGLDPALGGGSLEAADGSQGAGMKVGEAPGDPAAVPATAGLTGPAGAPSGPDAPEVKVPNTGNLRTAVVDLAKQYIGTPYLWGGSRPGGFDCSGLIQYAFSQAGLRLPRVSFEQLRVGAPKLISQLQPGDLVGFGTGGHLALYIGGGQIIEAPRSGLKVRIRKLGPNEDAFGVSLDSLFR